MLFISSTLRLLLIFHFFTLLVSKLEICLYDSLGRLLGYGKDNTESVPNWTIPCVQATGGFIAGAMASCVTNPLDTIKTRLQVPTIYFQLLRNSKFILCFFCYINFEDCFTLFFSFVDIFFVLF